MPPTFCTDGIIPDITGFACAVVIIDAIAVWADVGIAALVWSGVVGVAGVDGTILAEAGLTAPKGEFGNVALR